MGLRVPTARFFEEFEEEETLPSAESAGGISDAEEQHREWLSEAEEESEEFVTEEGTELPQHLVSEEEAGDEELGDASAHHNVDPLPPSEFRLKDIFGGGRKKDDEPERSERSERPSQETQRTVPAVFRRMRRAMA